MVIPHAIPVSVLTRQETRPARSAKGIDHESISETHTFFSKLVQLTLLNILFDLAIPSLSVKFRKPSAESGELGRLELLNFLFDIFDLSR